MLRGNNIVSSSIRSVVLHTKYSSDFKDVVKREATRQIYWNGGAEYKMFKNAGLIDNPLFSFKGDCSIKFENSQQLVNLGFMKSNSLFHYEKILGLPKYDENKSKLKTSIFNNPEKVKILADTVKSAGFKSIIDTSFNGGYNACIILNNCNKETNVFSIGEDKEYNKVADTYLSSYFNNFKCKMYNSNFDGIKQLSNKIDFCFLDGLSDYDEIKHSLEHLVPLINKDGMILINNAQLPAIKDAVKKINWDGFIEINFKTNNNFPVICMSRKEVVEYIPLQSDKSKQIKYIGIGLSESGFDEIRKMANFLNFKTQTYLPPNEMYKIKEVDYIDDLPMCNIFKKIDAEYDAKFIYTKLDLDTWLDKCSSHWERYPISSITKMTKDYRIQTYGTEKFDREKFKEVYLKHDNDIMEYFEDKKDKLLIVNTLEEADLTRKVLEFIGLDNLPKKIIKKGLTFK